MARPVILTVDDEVPVLNAIERDLRRHYGREYRVIKSNSGTEGLQVVQQLKQRNDPLALFLVDQRMPEMTGTEFLEQAIKLYPDAKKVLLTAYADTSAAIASINEIGLDHYLMKPWDPPEDHLYPVLDDILSDWISSVVLPYDGIRVAGTMWSSTSHDVKDFLTRNQIPYYWQDIETDDTARALVEAVSEDGKLPVVFFPDGETLIQPDHRVLAEKVGLQTEATQPFYDVIIIGAGPAGLGSAVYAGSEGLRTLMIEKQATGGQAGTSSRIENYLGFPSGVSGGDLARRAATQAQRFGVEILTTVEATAVRVDGSYRIVTLSDGSEVSCHALVIATGVTTRELDAPGVSEFLGRGVYYGASLSEAAAYRDQPVYIVGGANSAGQAAVFFARYASKVSLLIRGPALSAMSYYLIQQIEGIENIDVLTHTEVHQINGAEKLESLTLYNNQREETFDVPAGGLFIFIGAQPHTDMVEGIVERNRAGFIPTGPALMKGGKRPKNWPLQRDPYLLETNVPGIFAVGDVREFAIRRVASAVGEGAVAVNLIHQYLRTV